MKDLFFWAAEYKFFNKISGKIDECKISGVCEHYINLKANLPTEGAKLVRSIQEHIATGRGVDVDSVIVTSLSRLTHISDVGGTTRGH
jgi:hypothetical protein